MGGVLREGRLKNRANRLDHEKLYILQSYLMIWRGKDTFKGSWGWKIIFQDGFFTCTLGSSLSLMCSHSTLVLSQLLGSPTWLGLFIAWWFPVAICGSWLPRECLESWHLSPAAVYWSKQSQGSPLSGWRNTLSSLMGEWRGLIAE